MAKGTMQGDPTSRLMLILPALNYQPIFPAQGWADKKYSVIGGAKGAGQGGFPRYLSWGDEIKDCFQDLRDAASGNLQQTDLVSPPNTPVVSSGGGGNGIDI